MGDRSVTARDIKGSVVVTGDGNAVRLVFGDSGIVLPLRRKQFPSPDRRRPPRAGEPPRELDLLVPEAGKLPLIGRLDLLAELQTWLDDPADILVYGLIGRAGTGKTRLAIEFCKTVDSDWHGKGPWIAGFLSPSDLDQIDKAFATRLYDWGAIRYWSSITPHSLTRPWDAGSTGFRNAGSPPSCASCCSTAKRPTISAGGMA